MAKQTLRVPLIDDDKETWVLMRALLLEPHTLFQCELDWAPTVEDGWKRICLSEHDVCLLNCQPESQEGLHFLRDAVADGCSIPLILLTAAGDSHSGQKAVAIGAADYLSKGQIDAAGLERSIRYALERSRRMQAETALRDSEALYHSLVDSLPVHVLRKDLEGRFDFANRAFCEFVGRTADEIIGKTDYDFSPTEIAEKFRHDDRLVVETGKPLWEIETNTTDGQTRWVEVTKTPVRNARGSIVGVHAVAWDVTERQMAVKALHEAKKAAESASSAKSDFLANMSHEIGTPMNAIIGMTDLVLDTPLDATQRDYLSIVAQSAESLLSLINQVLDFSKIESGKLELESVDFDVRTEVGDALKSLGLHAHSKNLELILQVHSTVPDWLSGDSVRLRQVIVNLVGNAIKFTEQGEVFVEVQCEPSEESRFTLHISVRDTGVGIPVEKIEQIFSAFEQADTSTTREFGGTGLGLAITSSIANAMDGRVWVESVLGDGSTFHFTGHFGQGAERHEAEMFADLTGLPVLVVDDNKTNRRILKAMLENRGMLVKTVDGGPQAIRVLQDIVKKHEPVPLVISDVNMPTMDGFMLTEQLRSMTLLQDTVIVMLTSGWRAGDVRRCAELGVRCHVMKPIKQSELLEVIVDAIGGNASRSQAQPETADDAASLPPLRILLAEDGKANQVMAVGLLTTWGHSVEVAENGEAAISLWQSGSFDLILLDVQMPVLDGLEATRRIREFEDGTGQRMPIVAMTARAMKGDRERCLAAGMDDYVSKPVRRPDLDRVLRNLPD
jgi:PAS domain S-box-containing protein